VTSSNPALYAVSRLVDRDVFAILGVEPSSTVEIPHVTGAPVKNSVPKGAASVHAWPNIAGKLEAHGPEDRVVWNRTFAAAPSDGVVLPTGDPSQFAGDPAALRWFGKFLRSLEQFPGVVIAAPSDTTRAIVLTPWGMPSDGAQPEGVLALPRPFPEFPGGLCIVMDAASWSRHMTYAAGVRDWFSDRTAEYASRSSEDQI